MATGPAQLPSEGQDIYWRCSGCRSFMPFSDTSLRLPPKLRPMLKPIPGADGDWAYAGKILITHARMNAVILINGFCTASPGLSLTFALSRAERSEGTPSPQGEARRLERVVGPQAFINLHLAVHPCALPSTHHRRAAPAKLLYEARCHRRSGTEGAYTRCRNRPHPGQSCLGCNQDRCAGTPHQSSRCWALSTRLAERRQWRPARSSSSWGPT